MCFVEHPNGHQRLQTDLGLRRQLIHLLSLAYNRRATKSTLRNMHPPRCDIFIANQQLQATDETRTEHGKKYNYEFLSVFLLRFIRGYLDSRPAVRPASCARVS